MTLASTIFLSRNFEEYINHRKKEFNNLERASQFKNGKNVLKIINEYVDKNERQLIQLYNLIFSLIITISTSIIIVVGSVYPLSLSFFFIRIPFDFNDILNDNLIIWIKRLALSSFLYGIFSILIFIINLINGINKDLGEIKNWVNGKLKENAYKASEIAHE